MGTVGPEDAPEGGAWRPVLAGAAAAAALAAARAIGDDLATAEIAPADVGGVALFWAYAAGVWDDEVTAARYEAAVDRLVARVAEPYDRVALFGGLAGDGWVLAHVAGDGADELLAMIDDTLLAALADEPWGGHYDLISGLVGLGAYFRERLLAAPGAAPARAGLAAVLRHLDRLHVHAPGGAAWHTPPALLPPWQREHAPAGHRDVGVAHGVAGVAALLGGVVPLDARLAPRARHLRDEAAGWLWAQRLPATGASRLPAVIVPGRAPAPSRTAWCYGDLGVALALWASAAHAGASTDEVRALAREVAARPPERCGVSGPGLCHGALGHAHLLSRCLHGSGDPAFGDAARAWYARALAERTPGAGLGGFLVPVAVPPGAPAVAPIASASLLEGSVGVGLALLAAAAPSEPGWDRLLLVDVPAAGAPGAEAAP